MKDLVNDTNGHSRSRADMPSTRPEVLSVRRTGPLCLSLVNALSTDLSTRYAEGDDRRSVAVVGPRLAASVVVPSRLPPGHMDYHRPARTSTYERHRLGWCRRVRGVENPTVAALMGVSSAAGARVDQAVLVAIASGWSIILADCAAAFQLMPTIAGGPSRAKAQDRSGVRGRGRDSVGLTVARDHSEQAAPFVPVEIDGANLDSDTDEVCVEWKVNFVFEGLRERCVALFAVGIDCDPLNDLADGFVFSWHRRHS